LRAHRCCSTWRRIRATGSPAMSFPTDSRACRASASEMATKLLVVPANETREALVAAGRHETGQCCFSIDASLMPNLPALAQLELYDAETGILIYRHRAPARKILRLGTHLFPLWRLDDALRPTFHITRADSKVWAGRRDSTILAEQSRFDLCERPHSLQKLRLLCRILVPDGDSAARSLRRVWWSACWF